MAVGGGTGSMGRFRTMARKAGMSFAMVTCLSASSSLSGVCSAPLEATLFSANAT